MQIRKLKKKVWRYCSRYIKKRDAQEDFSITKNLDWVICRTCGKWLKTKSKEAQVGHFIGRGIGGGSGVYFDERNLAVQCYQCNCFRQGNSEAYREFMLRKYGQKIIDELKLKDKTHQYTLKELEGLFLYYKGTK